MFYVEENIDMIEISNIQSLYYWEKLAKIKCNIKFIFDREMGFHIEMLSKKEKYGFMKIMICLHIKNRTLNDGP